MRYILIILCLLLAGCTPAPGPPDPPVPVTSIRIEPDRADVELGESIELACLDQLDRAVCVSWTKYCNAGTLSTELGTICVYTTPRTMTGVQTIWATCGEMKAEARINGIKQKER